MKLADALVYLATEDSGLKKGFDAAKEKTGSWAANLGSIAKTALTGVVVGAATAAAAAVISVGAAAMDVSVQTQQASADIAASLGVPTEEARKFAEVAKQVYGNNFADSVTDAGDAVAIVAKQLQLAADDPALKTMTENAFRLRDVFGADVTESVDAAKTLMDNFGLSGQEAFDLLASGYQKGLDRSGDFLDTIGEYSTQFASGGASATAFFNLLDSGLAGGALGTDKAADAFKEFRVRIQDGSKLTAESLESIGINSEFVLGQLARGEVTAAQVFDLVTQKLGEQTDSTRQMQAGVGLLGTQFEDLGNSAAVGLDLYSGAFANVEGSITSLDAKYATFGSAADAIWRKLVVSVSPFTDKLLELVNDAMPAVMGAFDRFDATVGPTMERGKTVIDAVVNFTKNLFGGFRQSADNDLTGPMAYWKDWLDANMPRIQQIISTVLLWIQAFWANWGEQILTVVRNTFDVAWVVIDTAMRTIGDLITLVLQVITGDWEGAGETLRGILERYWSSFVIIVSTQLDSLRTLFTNVDWAGAGQAIVSALWGGIVAAWEWGVRQPFERKLAELRALLPFSEPKDPRSPLRNLRKAGATTVGMIREGMDAELNRLSSDFSSGLAALVTPSGQTAGAGAGMPIEINVYLSGSATYEDGRRAANGIRDEIRQRGLS